MNNLVIQFAGYDPNLNTAHFTVFDASGPSTISCKLTMPREMAKEVIESLLELNQALTRKEQQTAIQEIKAINQQKIILYMRDITRALNAQNFTNIFAKKVIV